MYIFRRIYRNDVIVLYDICKRGGATKKHCIRLSNGSRRRTRGGGHDVKKEVTGKLAAEQGEEGKGNRKEGDDCGSRKGGEKNKGGGGGRGAGGFRVMMSWGRVTMGVVSVPAASLFIFSHQFPLRHKAGFL